MGPQKISTVLRDENLNGESVLLDVLNSDAHSASTKF